MRARQILESELKEGQGKCPGCGSDRLLIQGDKAICLDCKAKLSKQAPDVMAGLIGKFGNMPGVTVYRGGKTYTGGKLDNGTPLERAKDWLRRLMGKPLK